MKQRDQHDLSDRARDFISHYVQMKRHLVHHSPDGFNLYIPLRSDETEARVLAWLAGEQLYIPLRSDETIC